MSEEDISEQYKGKLKLSFSDSDIILRDNYFSKKEIRKWNRFSRKWNRKIRRWDKKELLKKKELVRNE